ncbi:glycoside hydrolase family 20 [Euzebyella marina]|uniref:beta-N-acetylhexosaminidase n=1 Tax=Euzebyella marina TaxID=1761453 RepID=A0A3G2LAF2_9FLAO|nr:beta-N-acetylhexosaminidase [Euzebyella marina]AYN69237.1 glycoside hydrolase family 20 [Euzebyella marina]
MKCKRLLFAMLVICSTFWGRSLGQEVSIIPKPNFIKVEKGSYKLSGKTSIVASEDLENEVVYLKEILKSGFNESPKLKRKGKGIILELDSTKSQKLGEEGYELSISDDGIKFTAAQPRGIFYGIQTFRQLLPKEFEYENKKALIELPFLTIVDKPRFSWRAFMLDESRHFKGMSTVKKLIDQLALLKMNTFHWHLTDDQGWRIEIKKYPQLTKIGSQRKDTQTARKSDERTGEPHGGFYTQDEIREVIEYAKERHITIVPEIEMPGHATAAVASYNWLGTLGTTKEVSETFGKLDESFNVADPKVIRFLKDVLDEVMLLFPGKVIHIGGDEVNFEPWLKNHVIVDYMKSNNLNSPMDLQISFTNEMSNYIDKAGKRMMGWNEIMGHDIHEDRGYTATETSERLASSAIVHFWKGELDLIGKAVEDGYDVVNSNHWDTYLDYTYKRLPLAKSYAFDPIPDGLEEKYHSKIVGFGTQMWTEWVPTVASMEKQIFPRLAAYSEVGWTNLSDKNFEQFQQALKRLKYIWEVQGVEYQ